MCYLINLEKKKKKTADVFLRGVDVFRVLTRIILMVRFCLHSVACAFV